MLGRLANNELEGIWKEMVCLTEILSRNLPRVIEENHEQLHNNPCPGRDSNRAPPEYESQALPLERTRLTNSTEQVTC
jgi:hypothetical protein